MRTKEVFFQNARPLIEAVNAFAEHYDAANLGIADHFCYKCGSPEEFVRIRGFLELDSKFTYQSVISGRLIAYLRVPIELSSEFGPLRYLELSDQKPDGSQTSGFDHVEIYPAAGSSYDNLHRALVERGVEFNHVDRPHHTTHDHALSKTFTLRLTQEPLITKIKRDEMV